MSALNEHFELERWQRRLMLASPWLMGAFTLLAVSLPFLPDDGAARNKAWEWAIAACGALFFGAWTWVAVKTVRQLRTYAISLDETGIWPAHRPRDSSLLRWQEVRGLRERPVLQRLELLDASGHARLSLEYQLERFEYLRGIVVQRAALATAYAQALALGIGHHVISVGVLIAAVAGGLYIFDEQPFLGAICIIVLGGALAWEYLTTPSGLQIRPSAIVIEWPGRRREIRPQDVQAIELGDSFANYARHPQVRITDRWGKQVVLRRLGQSAAQLHRTLVAWRGDTQT
jgi:hypothetical protein